MKPYDRPALETKSGCVVACSLYAFLLQRVGEPLPEAIAAAESARAAFKAAASSTKLEAATAAYSGNGTDSSAAGASINTNERDERVSRLVARGPDGTRGFHTCVDGKRWTGVEAWVVRPRPRPAPQLSY